MTTIEKLRLLDEEKVIHAGPTMLGSEDAHKLLALVEAMKEWRDCEGSPDGCKCSVCVALRAIEEADRD